MNPKQNNLPEFSTNFKNFDGLIEKYYHYRTIDLYPKGFIYNHHFF